jgi:sec-independent protein translocase protein TatB
MFDIGFTELLLVALVALVVLGPERLPGAVRTAGLWIGRIKRSFNSIKAEVEREIGADEIRRQLHNEQILELEREMKAMKQDILSPNSTAEPTPTSPTATTSNPDTLEASPETESAVSQDKAAQP